MPKKSMRFTVLRSKAVSRKIVTNNNKLYAYNTSMGNSKFNVSDAIRLFFPTFKGSKHGSSYRG